MRPSRALGTGAAATASADDVPAPAGWKSATASQRPGRTIAVPSKHGCATLSKADRDPEDWKGVPIGTCVKFGGTLAPPKK